MIQDIYQKLLIIHGGVYLLQIYIKWTDYLYILDCIFFARKIYFWDFLIIVHDENRSIGSHNADRIRMAVDFYDINHVPLSDMNVIGLGHNVIIIRSLFTKYLN